MRLVAIGVAVLGLAGLAHADTKNSYRSMNLVSDEPGEAPVIDPLLVNAWGIAQNPAGPWWVSNEGTGTSTLYNGAGTKLALEVTIPAAEAGGVGSPTGIVFYGGSAFQLSSGAPARFIFATIDGTFSAWAPGMTTAEITFSDEGSVYLGLAIHGDRLYTTDFTECEVEAFDGNWEEVETAGEFEDDSIEDGYCPFGIQVIGDSVFVTYALRGIGEEVPGIGLGFVREFDLDGNLVAVVADHGRLNAPWGVAMAPADFGRFSGCLLVGNFGDGRINAFCKDDDGMFHPGGRLREGNRDLVVDGLWGLAFGNGNGLSPTNVLYFAAGPDDEEHGYFGKIEVAP
jgi:uncharacterized protein (TIGR03118 family)